VTPGQAVTSSVTTSLALCRVTVIDLSSPDRLCRGFNEPTPSPLGLALPDQAREPVAHALDLGAVEVELAVIGTALFTQRAHEYETFQVQD
jgi:hypothetical protein